MASLSSAFDRLASSRRRTLALTEGVDQASCDRRPAKTRMVLGEAGAWSIGEILDHVMRVFTSLVGEIETLYELDARGEPTVLKRTLKDYDVAPAMIPMPVMCFLEPGFQLANTISSAVLPASVREGIMRNRILPIKNPKKWIPVAGRDIAELRAELESSFAALETLMKRETRKPLKELIVTHTIFGKNSVPEVLGILEVHESWHQKDLESLVGN